MNEQTGPVSVGIGRPATLPGSVIRWLVALTACASAGIATAVAGPAFAVGLVLAALGAIAFTYLPGTLLAAYLLIPFYKGAVQPFSPVDLSVLLAAANALQVIPLVLDSRRPHISRTAIVLWVALACLVLFGVVYAPDQRLATSRAANYWALVFLLCFRRRCGSGRIQVRQAAAVDLLRDGS